ncbi:MAG: recombination protein RecR [Ruminococcaceae bacterium]|nr:recombination protein RecR [Oscillospiraceae bacterium]
MSEYIEPIERLADMFRRLEGVGKKSALRMAFSVLDMSEESAREFAEAVIAAKTQIKLCSVCQNISVNDVCDLCSSHKRDKSVICVVEDSRAVMAIEKSAIYNGLYHVLHGAISPMHGVGPDKLKIKELLTRLNSEEVSEIIVATNPTVEGEATAMYISKLITPLGIKVSRIANGVPVGGDLEYADEVTLRRAIEGRRTI